MDIVLAVLDKVVALGAFVMMPVVLFIMGMIFKMCYHYSKGSKIGIESLGYSTCI